MAAGPLRERALNRIHHDVGTKLGIHYGLWPDAVLPPSESMPIFDFVDEGFQKFKDAGDPRIAPEIEHVISSAIDTHLKALRPIDQSRVLSRILPDPLPVIARGRWLFTSLNARFSVADEIQTRLRRKILQDLTRFDTVEGWQAIAKEVYDSKLTAKSALIDGGLTDKKLTGIDHALRQMRRELHEIRTYRHPSYNEIRKRLRESIGILEDLEGVNRL